MQGYSRDNKGRLKGHWASFERTVKGKQSDFKGTMNNREKDKHKWTTHKKRQTPCSGIGSPQVADPYKTTDSVLWYWWTTHTKRQTPCSGIGSPQGGYPY